MRKGYQLSLFGGEGKGRLFDKGVLAQHLDDHRTTQIPNADQKMNVIARWLESLDHTDAKESSLEQQFLNEIFCGVLGYSLFPYSPESSASLYVKPASKLTKIAGTPDAMLGEFCSTEFRFDAAVELKSPGTNLDLPQAGHKNKTPVEQGHDYGSHILGVNWVIISDMRVIRLYSVESEGEYEEFDLRECKKGSRYSAERFRAFYFLLHHDHLIQDHENSQVRLLYNKSAARQLEIRDAFYRAYYDIRTDLYEAIRKASLSLTPSPTRSDLLQATQRLLDRLLFIYYCEDHPQQLISDGTVKAVTNAARQLPGTSNTKVYEYLKVLFREVDAGSPEASGVRVTGYNGELFKDHWIIDHIDLPDSLHDKPYRIQESQNRVRVVQGVWGLYIYDFWTELNEHLLGHIFEESLSDLEELGSVSIIPVSEKLRERKKDGIFYTNSILSDFLSASAIHTLLEERAPINGGTTDELIASLTNRLAQLLQLRIIDFACGSGAFLVSAYREMLQEFWRVRISLNELHVAAEKKAPDLFNYADTVDQASLLRDCLSGVDKLPQAVEIAKLALWLRSARKGEKVPELSESIVVADSLAVSDVFAKLGKPSGSYDLVIGNPPWGSEIDPDIYGRAITELDVRDEDLWDSWELFLLLGLKSLREGGRLALVLPDSFFYSKKVRLRELLFSFSTVEKVHNLGPDWFGKRVRMGTIVVQARRGPVNMDGEILCALLAGELRERAIRGEVPLTQVETQRGRLIPVSRSATSPTYELEVFRGKKDDDIMRSMDERSSSLGQMCERTRGEEINKAGILWVCPSCLTPTTPGVKKKGGGYERKICENCGLALGGENVTIQQIVTNYKGSAKNYVTFIDGDDVNRRYQTVDPDKWMYLGLSG